MTLRNGSQTRPHKNSSSIFGIAAAMVGGYPIFKEAVNDILERRMTMELSMTIALIAALLIGEFFTALNAWLMPGLEIAVAIPTSTDQRLLRMISARSAGEL